MEELTMERSIKDKPRGNDPVFFSLSENSIIFIDASTASMSKPSSASFLRELMINSFSYGISSSKTPFNPMLN